MLSGKESLSATNLAVHHHFNCDLYLHNVYHQPRSKYSPPGAPQLYKARLQRGVDWEEFLLAWLNRQKLLLEIPSQPLHPDVFLENIQMDSRDHFFVAGLSFRPPQDMLDGRFRATGRNPVRFGVAKPDLLEITRNEEGVEWKVVDAKGSSGIKTSHHIQIYFYSLCLAHILPRPFFTPSKTAAIWLPPAEGFGKFPPSLDDFKSIDLSMLSSSIDQFLFGKLPDVLSSPVENVMWHYNPLCRGCPYEQGCKTNTVQQGEIGSMPNISLDDARTLRVLLDISPYASETNLPSERSTDIEDLHKLVDAPTKLEKLASLFPSTLKRGRRILAIPRKGTQTSPVVEAARTHHPQVKYERNLTCPRHEDIAIVMSFVSDSSSATSVIERYTITIVSAKQLSIPSTFRPHGSGSDLVPALALLIKTILHEQTRFSPTLSTQFYVWSSNEQSALQAHLINTALISTEHADQVRTCIGALSQGASLLHTTYQPILLSGALLNFLTKSNRTRSEHIACLERMELSTHGTAVELQRRIDESIRHLQTETGRSTISTGERVILGQLPRVVVLKREVEHLLALPVPGYWDLPECTSILLPEFSPTARCPTDDEVYANFLRGGIQALDDCLIKRNESIYAVLQDVRERISRSGNNLLVNDAKMLSSNFLDLCRQEHIRKLFFVQQFEVLTKLNELWRARIDGCPDAPLLQYLNLRLGPDGTPEYAFRLISGTLDMPATDRTHSMYDKIIALDEDGDPSTSIPVEALFDDLAVSGLVFPLNKHTRSKWDGQHPIVRKELCVADLRNIIVDGTNTLVFLKVWCTTDCNFIQGRNYRLSPRLVDFNTSKALEVLLEMDLRCSSNTLNDDKALSLDHCGVPFLQIILDPVSFGRNSSADQYLKLENQIQNTFRALKELDNEVAGSLVLKASQHQAAQKILSNRLSIIWGPPGTGKTHTVALSLLRLLEVQHRLGVTTTKVVFITAMTHAAIDACRKKLMQLMDAYRSIPGLPTEWLDRITVEQVLNGRDHRLPPKDNSDVYIYAGTTYQLYNFTRQRSVHVDCVVIDEAGQLALSSVALVLRNLSSTGRVVIAGDSEQLAPILTAQYPQLRTRPLFSSVLDCLMNTPQTSQTVVQLTENFRLNADLGAFVSTIYSRAFTPQKAQTRQLAHNLSLIEKYKGCDLGIEPEVLKDVQTFLLSLSKVMLRQAQTMLSPPRIKNTAEVQTITGLPLPPQEISLALLNLQTVTMNSKVEDAGYEIHIRGEAAVAAAFVTSIQRCSPNDDIFVATPHRVQREAVKAALARIQTAPDSEILGLASLSINDARSNALMAESTGKVTVDTIERLQGSEAAFVICLFSVARSPVPPELGFLLERRRLNVAISRAKTLCVLVTSPEVLRPGVGVLTNEETIKGYAFLKAFEERAWSSELKVDLDNF